MNTFITAAHKIAQHDLPLGASGNLACCKDGHHMLISASGSALPKLRISSIFFPPF
jgi:ribulose-5-phosphate 4-epimerase/fuculose-1-phosphate aldolase